MLSKQQDFSTVAHSSLFQGVKEEELKEALTFLGALERHYRKNAMVFLMGDSMDHAGLVLEGTLELSFLDEGSNSINMNHFFAGNTFGESLSLWDGYSPLQLQALTDCRILFLDLKRVMEAEYLKPGYQSRIGSNLLRDFSRQNVFLNLKVRIMSQRRLRDRIRFFLRQQSFGGDKKILLPFNRNQLAEFLGVNRCALSRELSVMQEEGILRVEGSCFQILKEDFLRQGV